MARKPRIHLDGALYHVMLRGNGGQAIFLSDDDHDAFEALVTEGISRFGHRIHAYCWMGNHVHLAIQVADTPLSKIMQNLAFRYTRQFNRREERIGHLFQGRFKALLVDADSYLLELVRYIHLNPVRAKLVADPADYTGSGHRAYLGKAHKEWLTTDWVLAQFASSTSAARRRYEAFVHAGLHEGHREEFHRERLEGAILGQDRFVEKIVSRQATRPSRRIPLDAIIRAVAHAWETSQGALHSPSRVRTLAEARSAAAYLVAEYGEGTLTSLGQALKRDVSTLSMGAQAIRLALPDDSVLRKKVRVAIANAGTRQNTK
jgi:REP element-mobilizing transposase RayT